MTAKKRPRTRASRDRKPVDPFFAQLASCKRAERQGFADAWVSLEPTFSNEKLVRKWDRLTDAEGGEDAYFEHSYVLKKMRSVARAIASRYRACRKLGDPACRFARCKLGYDRDPWGVARANLRFTSPGMREAFEVRFGIDPEAYEYSIKPVPLAWLHDELFVRFLDRFVWGVPREEGLAPSIGHGGGQFSFSVKTFLAGSLLADDIATKLNHPELSCWIFDYPNPDDRPFRATTRRFRAFRTILGQYWSGAFHPRAIGALTVENAFLDRGFSPAASPPAGLMHPRRGPIGSRREIFQTNFAFGRKVRWNAQNVDPGYWQASHPDADGFRPDQVMRYSEGNLNRLQIAGEWHVKSGKLLDAKDIAEFDRPLEPRMLYEEACWEQRAQMSKVSATDMIESILLETHHAQWLVAHPHVRVTASLLQDQLLGDAERTLARTDPALLARLRKEAVVANLAASRQRVKSERIEPEVLFWAAWHSLGPGEQAEIAREALGGFHRRVMEASTMDPRPQRDDPMEPHRHRVHPLLWRSLQAAPGCLANRPELERELRRWEEKREVYLARRPPWSVAKGKPPWKRSLSRR